MAEAPKRETVATRREAESEKTVDPLERGASTSEVVGIGDMRSSTTVVTSVPLGVVATVFAGSFRTSFG